MKILITVDLGFGDAGKGTVVDALVRRYGADLVVRHNGGSQASHTVYTDDGRCHHFSQIGSGSFVPTTYTLLSQFMLVNPLVLLHEHEALIKVGITDAINRVFIDGRAIMVTPYHRAVNRLRELARGGGRHGSCGAGIGETMADALAAPDHALRMSDFHDLSHSFAPKLMAARDRMMKIANNINAPDSPEALKQLSTFRVSPDRVFERYREFYLACGPRIVDDYSASHILSSAQVVIFEAAQGVLLDERFGFHPYTTWSKTTAANAKLLLEEAEVTDKPTVIGITRSYATRHGAGPFPTESQEWTRKFADQNNEWNPWQEILRSGPLDLPLLKYALKINGTVDCLAVTHLDKVTDPWPVCPNYGTYDFLRPMAWLEAQEHLTNALFKIKCPSLINIPKEKFLAYLAEELAAPIGITSSGPFPKDKQFHGILENIAV
jgi:adenylosuccinate synthase